MMNYASAMHEVGRGKKVARIAWMGGATIDQYNEYLSGEELDERGLTRADIMATDYVVEPVRSVTVNEAAVIRAWNASLPAGTTEENQAPNSPRYKRFWENIRASRG